MPFSCFKKTRDNDSIDEPYHNWKGDEEDDDSKRFFVITTIFNPVNYSSRYELYREFARHMEETGAQLITVECIFPELNQTQFQVTSPINPLHVQLRSKSVYWMKENLINIAANRLPAHAKWICWLDSDILFHEVNWIRMTIEQLKQHTVVQVFKKAKFLGPPPQFETLRVDYSFGYSVIHNKPIDQKRYEEWYPHPGYGWAMTLETFKLINGLPEYDILGSADLHFAFSLLNKVSNVLESNLNPEFAQRIIAHSAETYNRIQEYSRVGHTSSVGYVPVTISHCWHGSKAKRQYVDRWKILIAHQFDFARDMTPRSDGLWEFVQGKESLQKDILDYFRFREDDSIEIDPEPEVKRTRQKHKDEHYWVNSQQVRWNSPPLRGFLTQDAAVVGAANYPISYEDPLLPFPNPGEPCDPDPDCCDPCEPDCPYPCEPDYCNPCEGNSVRGESDPPTVGGYADDYGGYILTSSYY